MEKKLLYTEWGEKLDKNFVLDDYPRPQLERRCWRCFNGLWDYAFTDSASEPESYEGKILVPFSPEAPLSGVGKRLEPGKFLHYSLAFDCDETNLSEKNILHFGAVDERCGVFLNGEKLGEHRGGYLPFSFDVSAVLKNGENVLTLWVSDDSDSSFHAHGKQVLKPEEIWYTAQSGIWQTVWMEQVPENYIKDIKITPDLDDSSVEMEVSAENPVGASIVIKASGNVAAEGWTDENGLCRLKIFDKVHEWSPEDPFLYDVEIILGDDVVKSYFGMRKFSVETASDGKQRLFLNGKEYFQSGVLDQGYWPDGLLTAPSDNAMIIDIMAMKKLGFNMLRKHIKIEPLRWYYHCDRLGMLVWQDMVNGGVLKNMKYKSFLGLAGLAKHDDSDYAFFGRESDEGRNEFIADMEGTVKHLYNCVSISLWTIFNEGWGQFDSAAAAEKLQSLDKTRIIDRTSGWFDQGGGELFSRHVYFRKFKMKADSRACVLSEFGGYNCMIENHSLSEGDYGYRRFADTEHLAAAFKELYEKEIIPAKAQGLCAAVYTQLSDVEDEVNGILTYDRKVCKLPLTETAELNKILTKG